MEFSHEKLFCDKIKGEFVNGVDVWHQHEKLTKRKQF